jgi:hypothetical protein
MAEGGHPFLLLLAAASIVAVVDLFVTVNDDD